ncbi:MAG: hypothetical protein NTV89_06860 [Proteobacteria bacterium]|nr:hypothetical protein [Pseudomonadota bacterium]
MIEYTTIIIGNSALCIATTTTIPSGETTTTTIPYNSSTTTTTPGGGQCPAKTVMGQDNPDLKTLRAFRNEMFIQSAVGKRYTTLYYNTPLNSQIFFLMTRHCERKPAISFRNSCL